MTYGYVWLPSDFIFLLQNDMQTTGYGFNHLKKNLWYKPQFQSILLRATKDLEIKGNFEKAMNSLGWLGIRDRICCLYLHHKKFGSFPDFPDLSTLKSLLEFEDKVSFKTTHGQSRTFLLGFYILMYQGKESSSIFNEQELNIFMSKELLSLLKKMNTKSRNLDWLILSLHYFLKFLDPEKIERLFSEKDCFNNLKNCLSEQDKYNFFRGMLSYGASIQNTEYFCHKSI